MVVAGRRERAGVRLLVECAAALSARLGGLPGVRLRVLGAGEPELKTGAAEHGVTVLDEPIVSTGRLELVRWLREQAVTTSLHPDGNIVDARRPSRPPGARWGLPGPDGTPPACGP